jgi:hypothetical protein
MFTFNLIDFFIVAKIEDFRVYNKKKRDLGLNSSESIFDVYIINFLLSNNKIKNILKF